VDLGVPCPRAPRAEIQLLGRLWSGPPVVESSLHIFLVSWGEFTATPQIAANGRKVEFRPSDLSGSRTPHNANYAKTLSTLRARRHPGYERCACVYDV
jgi:hypothetical protein